MLEFAPIDTAQCVIRCMLHSGRQWFHVVHKQELALFTTEATCHFGRAIPPMCEYNCMVRTPKAAKAETTKQKQHTTQNHSPSSSVAMSVHCCSHWCSHLTFIPPSCIGVRTLHFSCVPFRWSYRLAFRVCVCRSNSYKRLFVARCVAASPCRVCRNHRGITMVSPCRVKAHVHGYHHIG